jgi:catechol 2,3-dioxygenase-like lactoylglutathione lyase family enzyme
LKETIRFYEDIIGLKKTAEWSNQVTFDAGGFDLAFEPGGKRGGKVDHKECARDIFMEVDDVGDVYKKLKEKDVEFADEPKDEYWGP